MVGLASGIGCLPGSCRGSLSVVVVGWGEVLGLAGPGLRGVVLAVCGGGWCCGWFGLSCVGCGVMQWRGRRMGGVGGGGANVELHVPPLIYWTISKVFRRYKNCEI